LDATLADVVMVQEHKLSRDKVTRRLAMLGADGTPCGWETYWAFSTAKAGYSGVFTAVRKGAGLDVAAASSAALGPEFDDEGRCVVTHHGTAPGAGPGLTIVNVYTPNGGDRPERSRLPYKLRFLGRLAGLLRELRLAGRTVVLAGDMNIPRGEQDAFWSAPGTGGSLGYSPGETGWLAAACGPPGSAGACTLQPPEWQDRTSTDEIRRGEVEADSEAEAGSKVEAKSDVQSKGKAEPGDEPGVEAGDEPGDEAGAAPPLVDSFRECHPVAAGAYTVWDQRKAARTRNEGVRIDYVLCDRRLRAALRGACVLFTPPAWSDHVAVAADLDLDLGAAVAAGAAGAVCAAAAERWPGLRRAAKPITSFFGAAARKPKREAKGSAAGAPPGKRG